MQYVDTTASLTGENMGSLRREYGTEVGAEEMLESPRSLLDVFATECESVEDLIQLHVRS